MRVATTIRLLPVKVPHGYEGLGSLCSHGRNARTSQQGHCPEAARCDRGFHCELALCRVPSMLQSTYKPVALPILWGILTYETFTQ